VYYTVDGEPGGPISQQATEEVAHVYVCSGSDEHDDRYRWVVDVEGDTEWYFDGTLD
jgi:hypothetical protein